MKYRMHGTGKGERGFTLLETLLAVALAAMLVLGAWEFYVRYTTGLNDMSNSIEIATDIESGQQIMLKDLKSISPSYGAITLLADPDATGQRKPLLDWYPDVPEQNLPADSLTGRPSRAYTMRAPDGYAEAVFLLEDPSASNTPSMVYDPTWAFSFPAAASSLVDAAPPIFKGLNNGNMISTLRPADPSTNKPGYWHNKQLLMLDSPSLFRPTGSNMVTTQPRSPFFVGEVSGNQLVPVPVSAFNTHRYASADWDAAGGMVPDQTSLLNTSHPLNPALAIDSAEHFLTYLPPSGGGQPLVRLRPVRLVRYTIELMFPKIDPLMAPAEQKKRRNMLKVWRQVYNSGPNHNGWIDAKKTLMAEYVQGVQFRRPTITDKAIRFNISKDVVKNGGGN